MHAIELVIYKKLFTIFEMCRFLQKRKIKFVLFFLKFGNLILYMLITRTENDCGEM